MNKPPAFQLYVMDFTGDLKVKLMSLEEVGAYILLLCYIWKEDGIINNPETIKACLNKAQNSQKIFEKIKHCFYIKDGKIFNKRLDEERRKLKNWKNKSRLGGLKSAETRRLKRIKEGSRVVEPPLEGSLENGSNQSPTVRLNTSSSLSSSPSSAIKPNKEEKIIAPDEKKPSSGSSPSKSPKINFNFKTGEWENITEDKIKKWQEAFPAVDIEGFIKRLGAWLTANPHRKKSNYERFLVNNMRGEQDKGGTKGYKPTSPAAPQAGRLKAKIEGTQ